MEEGKEQLFFAAAGSLPFFEAAPQIQPSFLLAVGPRPAMPPAQQWRWSKVDVA
jgi:hypothetical protein